MRLHTWGFFVGLGIVCVLWIAYARARRFGLSTSRLIDWSVWAIVAAFISARIAHVFLYDWPSFAEHPIAIFKIWQGGLSSFGGFLGAAVASLIYARVKKINFWQYADVVMYGFPLGLGIGRLGCFINHLHVGIRSSSFLAVAFPDGPRLDMGLVESLFGFALFAVYVFLERKRPQKNAYLPITMVIYGIARFFIDFGRATDIPNPDVRFIGLTLAQFGSILLVIGGVIIWRHLFTKKAARLNIN
ncbi:prolipoprotein diacylglyceryl transferase [Candidatus Falkowbacteria bacterium]|nr:prolipoprotein diacylglyceryl transferase [Candidatus Falkowbacteria bacterium]